MKLNEQVTITVELNLEEASAFAEFLKRAGFSDFRALAINDEEAYLMRYASTKIQKALAENGIAPR
jgi:hypothetical protein